MVDDNGENNSGNGPKNSPKGIDDILNNASVVTQETAAADIDQNQLSDADSKLLNENDITLLKLILKECKGMGDAEIEVELKTEKFNTPQKIRGYVVANKSDIKEHNLKKKEENMEKRGNIYNEISGMIQREYGDITKNTERWYTNEQRETLRNLELVDSILNAVPYLLFGKKPLKRAQNYKTSLMREVANKSADIYLEANRGIQNNLEETVKTYESQIRKRDENTNTALNRLDALKSEFRDTVDKRAKAVELQSQYQTEYKKNNNSASRKQYLGMQELCSKYTRDLAALTKKIQNQEVVVNSIEANKAQLLQQHGEFEDTKLEQECKVIRLETEQLLYKNQVKDGASIMTINRGLLTSDKAFAEIDKKYEELNALGRPIQIDLVGVGRNPVKDHKAIYAEGERYIAEARRNGWLD